MYVLIGLVGDIILVAKENSNWCSLGVLGSLSIGMLLITASTILEYQPSLKECRRILHHLLRSHSDLRAGVTGSYMPMLPTWLICCCGLPLRRFTSAGARLFHLTSGMTAVSAMVGYNGRELPSCHRHGILITSIPSLSFPRL